MLLPITVIAILLPTVEDNWSQPVSVRVGSVSVVTYSAQIQGDFLVIKASHVEGWHTYAMDNKIRAKEKLAGKPSLGIEAPTTIRVKGVKTKGGWRQSKPEDMSQPKLRWYKWGFSGQSYFAIEVDKSTLADKLAVQVSGQVCDQSSCKQVDVELKLDQTMSAKSEDDGLKKLVAVRKK